MAGRVPDETIQAIRDRVSLVEVVSGYVHLKRVGRNYLGLCPFHTEKTPSFTVSDERGFYHCFGCGAGGTVFTFLMRVEHIEFVEAVEQLAKRAGIELPRRQADVVRGEQRNEAYFINEAAARFFSETLRSLAGAEARRYLARRGLKEETIERYGLGLAPASGVALVSWLNRQRIAVDRAVQLGLVGRRDDGSLYDWFRGRVMFPIRDRRGRVIAFGGRTLGDEQPKYLNSPETQLFRKGESLYGLAEAREAIRQHERVVLVEGYMDVLVLAQEGVPYVAGLLGTALTAAQLRLVRPFGGNDMKVYFLFDGDAAGRKAAFRAFAVCAEAEVWGNAVFLPDGHDPDSFVREFGRDAVLERIEEAVLLVDFYIDSIAPPGCALPQRAKAAEDVAQVLARVASDVRFELMARHAATRLGVADDVFWRVRRAQGRAATQGGTAPAPNATRPSWPAAEALLIEAMAISHKAAELADRTGVLARFSAVDLAALGDQILAAHEAGYGIARVVESAPAALASRITASLLGQGPLSGADPVQVAQDCIARIDREAERRNRRPLVMAVRQAETRGDDEAMKDKLLRLKNLLRREGSIA